MLLTAGAPQSNHCRQTAAAAARFGFACKLLLYGTPPIHSNGNLFLDGLLGAELIWSETPDLDDRLQTLFDSSWKAGERPYLIPVGGSNPVGAAGYTTAMAEFVAQDVKIDRILIATSSGGTQAGLLAGAKIHGYRGKITGIKIGKYPQSEPKELLQLIHQTADLLGETIEISEEDVEIHDQYLGEGYGKVSTLEREAIHQFARTEGVLLDPVYTGRAAGGMLDLIRSKVIDPDERVLFWHTGGTPALFAYTSDLD
jgi:1-aminocyclopropane-1-carboxylate deaminase/D-cysteine desulfhydrase-like pyridoxal-dependent ACC family enzyme